MASAPKKSTAAAVVEGTVAETPVMGSPAVETPAVAARAVETAAVTAPAAALAEVTKMMEAPLATLTEAHDKVRTMIETGLTETRANYSKAKGAADEAANAIESTYAMVKTGVVEINVKALAALRANAEANFDFIKSALAVKSPSEYVTLHGEFARKQIEMMTQQTKAMSELAQKVAADTVEPIKAQVAKTFKIAV